MTNRDNQELTPKQKAALPFFVGSKTIEEACKDAGISRNRYYEWLKESGFSGELNRVREEVVFEAIGQLKVSATKAVSTLCNLMDRTEYPSVQRAAANDVLSHVVRFKELHELEKRLDEVERLLNKQEDGL